jgi:hypothetical protein
MRTKTAIAAAISVCLALVAHPRTLAGQAGAQRTFATPEEAVNALREVTKAGKLDGLLAIFGPDSQEIVASSDAATAQQNREIFTAATAEKWRLDSRDANHKVLVIGNEDWPFPVPLVKDAKGWRFDTAAGKEEVIARRIGRNELAAIGICETYVKAQRRYAQQGHDGKPAGLFARTFTSDAGKQNGLYWPSARREPISPLGDLVAEAAQEGRTLGTGNKPTPFHGYYFKILTGQGPAAAGGAKSYLVDNEMSGGFALVAWPAQYDSSGVMTFVVNQDGVVFQKDLGPKTAETASAMTLYDPGASWHRVP